LFVLLAVFALQAQDLAKRGWVGVFIVCSIALITHPGVTSLGAIWLGGYVALLWLFRRREPTLWRRWVLILVASGALAFALTYLDMAQLYQTDDRGVGIPVSVGIDPFRSQQLVKGLSAAMRPIGYVLAGVSLGVLLWKTSGTRRYLVLAWCAASAVFLVVDLLLGMQVRYSYFATPMVCAGLGLLLDDLINRSWWGRVVSWGLLALICINGLIVWYSGVIWRVKPTLMGLSHG
jgi:hypothetical protein